MTRRHLLLVAVDWKGSLKNRCAFVNHLVIIFNFLTSLSSTRSLSFWYGLSAILSQRASCCCYFSTGTSMSNYTESWTTQIIFKTQKKFKLHITASRKLNKKALPPFEKVKCFIAMTWPISRMAYSYWCDNSLIINYALDAWAGL